MLVEALRNADEVIAVLKTKGFDYSAHREAIALQLFDEGIYNGNWDSSTDLNDPELKDLRCIQEDEYDQSMPEDEKPDWNDMIDRVGPGYLWFE
jgi:hypothetical protein